MLFKTKGFIEPKGSRRDFEGGFFGISSTLIDAHTLPGQTEGLKVGCGGMGSRWLSRFKLIRLRRISLATFAAFGGAHNE